MMNERKITLEELLVLFTDDTEFSILTGRKINGGWTEGLYEGSKKYYQHLPTYIQDFYNVMPVLAAVPVKDPEDVDIYVFIDFTDMFSDDQTADEPPAPPAACDETPSDVPAGTTPSDSETAPTQAVDASSELYPCYSSIGDAEIFRRFVSWVAENNIIDISTPMLMDQFNLNNYRGVRMMNLLERAGLIETVGYNRRQVNHKNCAEWKEHQIGTPERCRFCIYYNAKTFGKGFCKKKREYHHPDTNACNLSIRSLKDLGLVEDAEAKEPEKSS